MRKIFTDSIIEQYKNNKQLITYELLQKLRSYGNEGKQIALEILDTEKTPDNYYIDAYGEKIAFLGDREIKRPFTKMKLAQIHIDELKRCAEDLNYFRENYVKIRTKDGINFPEMRPYQQGFLDALTSDYETIVSLQPRQCCSGDTKVNVDNCEMSFEKLFDECKNPESETFNTMLSQITKRKFIETYLGNGRKILTPLGYKEIEYIHKTIPYEKYRLKTESGIVLECAENHVIILEDGSECYAKNSLNKIVKTINGIDKIIVCEDLHIKENMYDISIKEDTELYYSNGILSHNSGKSVTTAIYMVWLFNFDHDKNMGICANNGGLAREFLNNVRNMFYGLPMWMRVGVSVWNKGTIESENKMRILTDSPSENSFRGYTLNFLVVDETAFIRPSVFSVFLDSVMPAQSALAWKKNLFISTANGMNHFYELVQGAKRRKTFKGLSKEEKEKIIKKNPVLETKQNEDGSFDVVVDKPSNGMLYYDVSWRDVPRFNSKGEQISHEEFREQVIDKYGLVYFNQNYGNEFIGSSYTLIDADILKNMVPEEPILKWDNRLDVFVEPIKDHKYIMAVDPAKGGLDAFAVQIIDVTSFPFGQVADTQIFKCNYQIMPEFLNEWGNRYNNAYMIIENNEGAGTFIANMMLLDFEYENLFFTKKDNGKFSKEPGFRTTTKTRTQILETFKHFVDNKRLIIRDKKTINELYSFIIKDNKYQADDGSHDDLVMSMALAFVPFISSRNFEDMKELVKKLYSDEDLKDTSFSDYLVIGNFDISVDEEESIAGKPYDEKYNYSYEYYSNPFIDYHQH